MLKIKEDEQILFHSVKGSLIENMIIAEYIKKMYHSNDVHDCWFWRDAAGHEVDFIVQDGLNLRLIEIKATHTVMPEMFKGLQFFEKLIKQKNLTKVLIHAGNTSHERTASKVLAWNNL